MSKFCVNDRLSHVKELKSFFNVVEKKVILGKTSTFWRLEDEFIDLIQSEFLIHFLHYELGQIAADAAYVPAGESSEYDFILFQSELATLIIRVIEPTDLVSERLLSRAEHCMFGTIYSCRGTGLTYRSLLQPDPFPVEVLDPSKKLIDEGMFTLEVGSIVKQPAAQYVVEIAPSSHPSVIVFLMSETVVGLQWEYDRKSLCPMKAIAYSPASSRLQFAAGLLGIIGTQESLKPLKVLLKHPAHYVRWDAVRAIMMLNCLEGKCALEEFMNDPHPHVRNAAEKALAGLSQKTPKK